MPPAPSQRTRVRRVPARAAYERQAVEAVLDATLISHMGFVEGEQPFVIPMLHARVGDVVYLHGSSASRLMRALAAGVPVCLTATALDGLVLARSAFHHSVNYRSAVLLGTARAVEPQEERLLALEAFTEKMAPGRWPEVRPPSRKELKGTRVLALGLDEASAKLRSGPPEDDEDDYALPVWAGVLPLSTVVGEPEPDSRLRADIPLPDHVAEWRPPGS